MIKKTILAIFALFACSLFFTKTIQAGGQSKQALLKQYNGNVVVIFTRSGCGPCNYLRPHFNQAKQQCAGKISFIEIHLNNSNKAWYKSEYGFSTFPTVMYFKNNNKALQHGSGNRSITANTIVNNVNAIYS